MFSKSWTKSDFAENTQLHLRLSTKIRNTHEYWMYVLSQAQSKCWNKEIFKFRPFSRTYKSETGSFSFSLFYAVDHLPEQHRKRKKRREEEERERRRSRRFFKVMKIPPLLLPRASQDQIGGKVSWNHLHKNGIHTKDKIKRFECPCLAMQYTNQLALQNYKVMFPLPFANRFTRRGKN